jgi:hypothetical protein
VRPFRIAQEETAVGPRHQHRDAGTGLVLQPLAHGAVAKQADQESRLIVARLAREGVAADQVGCRNPQVCVLARQKIERLAVPRLQRYFDHILSELHDVGDYRRPRRRRRASAERGQRIVELDYARRFRPQPAGENAACSVLCVRQRVVAIVIERILARLDRRLAGTAPPFATIGEQAQALTGCRLDDRFERSAVDPCRLPVAEDQCNRKARHSSDSGVGS